MTLDDLIDGTHPTDAGYQKLAAVWYNAFKKVEANVGFLVPFHTGR